LLTARGLWCLIVAGAVTLIGLTTVGVEHPIVAILGITLLVWYLVEGLLFTLRFRSTLGKIDVVREILQNGRVVSNAWSGIACTVRVMVTNRGKASWPLAIVMDRTPEARKIRGGYTEQTVEFLPNIPVVIEYELKSSGPGIYRFEGVEIRVADLAGFFYKRIFLRRPVDILILPPLTDSEGKQRADKRFNTLPPPGIHRLRRPGSGSELLDLRDYIAGDPPKMIAWKASAKKDKLITKELESDIPVRCTLFLDTSQAMRLGPVGETPLCRLSEVASSIAQAAAANRDLVGLTLFDEAKFDVLPAARNTVHTIRLLSKLADASAQRPDPGGQEVKPMVRIAYPLAQELYPELMSRRVNAMPLGRLWLPLLDRWWGWLVLLAVLYPALMVGAVFNAPRWVWKPWVEAMAMAAEAVTRKKGGTWVNFLILMVLPVVLGGLFWLIYGVRGWVGERRLRLTRRKRLAAVFALHDGTGPAGIERLVHDDEVYAGRVGRFLQERQIRMPVPLYDDRGRYRYRCPGKARPLAEALVRAVGRARDNELYVILADLAELGPDLAPVVRAARVARARHHHVMVVVPWPAGVPSPDEADRPPPAAAPKPKPRAWQPPRPPDRSKALLPVVKAALTRHYHEAFRAFRRAVGQAGATVVRVNDGDPIQVVLDRLDRLRGMRSRR